MKIVFAVKVHDSFFDFLKIHMVQQCLLLTGKLEGIWLRVGCEKIDNTGTLIQLPAGDQVTEIGFIL